VYMQHAWTYLRYMASLYRSWNRRIKRINMILFSSLSFIIIIIIISPTTTPVIVFIIIHPTTTPVIVFIMIIITII